jgi:hypothetical protein
MAGHVAPWEEGVGEIRRAKEPRGNYAEGRPRIPHSAPPSAALHQPCEPAADVLEERSGPAGRAASARITVIAARSRNTVTCVRMGWPRVGHGARLHRIEGGNAEVVIRARNVRR